MNDSCLYESFLQKGAAGFVAKRCSHQLSGVLAVPAILKSHLGSCLASSHDATKRSGERSPPLSTTNSPLSLTGLKIRISRHIGWRFSPFGHGFLFPALGMRAALAGLGRPQPDTLIEWQFRLICLGGVNAVSGTRRQKTSKRRKELKWGHEKGSDMF